MRITVAFFLLSITAFISNAPYKYSNAEKMTSTVLNLWRDPMFAQGKSKTVLLDYYFNHETKKDASGKISQWHYVWNEEDNGGYSTFGNIFQKYGVQTKALHEAPSHTNLKNANIYIIVDPDTKKENEHPNFIEGDDVNTIYNWVKQGGVLLLFGNDSGNVEFTHFNKLAAKFGIQFNYDSKNRVVGDDFKMGAIQISSGNMLFKTARKVYIKEYSSLSVQPPASAILSDGNTIIAAVAKIGKGNVFAVGDPWFYNEYVDGKKLTKDFENYQAAEDVVKWAVQKVHGY